MIAVLQLDPPLYVETPLGRGIAVIYESDAEDVWWTVILDSSQAIVQFRNNKVRAQKQYSYGRGITDDQMKIFIAPHGPLDKPPM